MFPTKTEVSSRLEGECLAYSGPQVDDCGVCYGDNLDKDVMLVIVLVALLFVK